MKSILKNSFFQLLVAYVVLVAIMYFGFISKFSIQMQIFAVVLAVLGISIISQSASNTFSKKVQLTLFILAIILIITVRVIPYIGNNIPLGYDAGIYKYAIEHGLERKDTWIVTGPTMEPAFLYLMEVFKIFFNTDFILKWLFILCTVLLGIALYWCTSTYFGNKSGIFAMLFYAVSVTQFLTFTYLYYRNVIGIALMLCSITFLRKYELDHGKKYWYLFIALAGLIGTIHRPTFYIFGLSYFLYAFIAPIKKGYDKRKLLRYVVGGIIILAISLLFYIGRFWPAITNLVKPVIGSFVETGESPGTFISFFQYQFITLAYLSFALLGLFFLINQKKFNFIVLWALVNASIVYFQLFFFNRFIINLDSVVIMLAGLGAVLIIQKKHLIGISTITLLIVASGFMLLQESVRTQPSILQEDLNLITQLGELTENNAYIIVLSKEYSPWVLAYSNRTIIAPGLFDENKWNLSQWNTFWYTNNENETKELMNNYDLSRPIYLYTGTKGFNKSCFILFLSETGGNAYKYAC